MKWSALMVSRPHSPNERDAYAFPQSVVEGLLFREKCSKSAVEGQLSPCASHVASLPFSHEVLRIQMKLIFGILLNYCQMMRLSVFQM